MKNKILNYKTLNKSVAATVRRPSRQILFAVCAILTITAFEVRAEVSVGPYRTMSDCLPAAGKLSGETYSGEIPDPCSANSYIEKNRTFKWYACEDLTSLPTSQNPGYYAVLQYTMVESRGVWSALNDDPDPICWSIPRVTGWKTTYPADKPDLGKYTSQGEIYTAIDLLYPREVYEAYGFPSYWGKTSVLSYKKTVDKKTETNTQVFSGQLGSLTWKTK